MSYGSLYFNVILVALVLLLLDAIREITRYKEKLHSPNGSGGHDGLHYGPTMELVKEFRAQRNFYISGTALFLWFVMKRLLALITNSARLIAENQAIKNQAESATRAANALLEQQPDNKDEKSKNRKTSESSTSTNNEAKELMELLELKADELNDVRQTLKSKLIDLEVMKKQSENLAREYDNLLKEHTNVTAKLEKYEYESGLSSGDKKKSN
jgi:B-cell receptor-associated protein 31